METDPAKQRKIDHHDERRTDRRQFDVAVKFRSGTRRATVKANDISQFGARISGVFLVHVGDRMFLTLPGIAPIEARVAWVAEFEFGCEFVAPLHQAILDAIIARG
jgi:hypothetical protein